MDGDEEEDLIKGEQDTGDVPCASEKQSAQVVTNKKQLGSGVLSLDVNDDFFSQDTFSYTNFLMSAFEDPLNHQPSSKQDNTQSYTSSKDGAGHPQSMDNDKHEQSSTNSSCLYQENNPDSSSTFFEESTDNPWDINMFNDIELDRVYDEGNTSNSKQKDYEDGPTTSSGGYHGEASRSNNDDTTNNDGSSDAQNITEQDVDNFLSNEKLTDEERKRTTNEDLADLKPEVGMQFKTREEVQKFFNMYSYVAGFSVTCTSVARTVSKKRNNEVIRFTMKCNKHGKTIEPDNEQPVPQRQSTVIAKTNCKTEMVAAEKDGVWRITGLNLSHNHELSPQSRFFRSHIYMSDGEKEMIRTMKNCNMPTRDMVAVLAYIRGGMTQLPYNKRKVTNYCASINREVSNSDMMEVWEWFCKKRTENPGFYYSIQYDKDKKVRCVFWADAKARLYYDMCGDCISFDTTFLTNRYNLPFAPFVGVSPHGNTYLFGCAFIVNEQAGTFKWLFEQFLHAMGGKHPISIITDADRAMENAIPKVFPNATHRGCLFHVKKKIDDKGGTVFKANEGLYEELQDIIDKSLTVHEFETLWQAMITEYDVGNVQVFQDLWKTREKWVPVYFKAKFFPFIQTTARSEGTNALFKRGVGAQFSMTSFLREYQRIIDTIHAKEDECDHIAMNKKVRPKKFQTHYYIERQAHELYNLSIFWKFQHVLKDVTRLNIDEEEKGRKYWLFQPANYAVKEHRPRRYLVQVNEAAMEYSCICCKFEKDGLLCSHILKVMLHLQVPEIPHKYIIDRWRKKDKKLIQLRHIALPGDEDSTSLRFNVLSRMLGHTASNASQNKRKYQFMLQEITRVDVELAKFDNETEEETVMGQNSSTKTVVNLDRADESASTLVLLNPDVVDTKGRPRLLTIKEQIKQNLFYTCSHCGSNSHTFKNCDRKDEEFDLPKKKKNRKKKQEGDEAATTKKKRAPAKRKNQNEAVAAPGQHTQKDAALSVNQQDVNVGTKLGASKKAQVKQKKVK